MVMCFVFGCNHHSNQKDKKYTCSFFRFPANKRARWSQLCRRQDREPLTQNDRICSCHFKDGVKDGDPVFFPHNDGKVFQFDDPEKRLKKLNRDSVVIQTPSTGDDLETEMECEGTPSGTQMCSSVLSSPEINSESDRIALSTGSNDDDGSYCVQRTKLLQCSGYYRSLVASGMRDAASSELLLPNLTITGLKSVHKFLNDSSFETGNLQHMIETVEAASYLQIDELVESCMKHAVANHLHDSWPTILLICENCGLADDRCTVLKYIAKNFHQIWQYHNASSAQFNNLSLEDLCTIIDDDDIEVSEKEIFTAAFSWLEHDRQRIIYEDVSIRVLSLVRFPLMSNKQLKECSTKLSESLINPSCYRKILEEAEDFRLNPRRCHIDAKRTRLRNVVPVVVAVGGFTSSEHCTNRFQIVSVNELEYLPQHKTDQLRFKRCRSEHLPVALCEHASCVVDNVLYVAGGQNRYNTDGRHTTRDVYCFDPRLCAWTKLSPMNVPRSLFYMGQLNGQLYAVAGWTAVNEDTSTVERYSPQTDTWQRLAAFPIDVHEHAGCCHLGALYVCGGFRGPLNGHIDRFWRYDVDGDRWLEKEPLLIRRSYHVMISFAELILVAGGVQHLGGDSFVDIMDCELYSEDTRQWTILTGGPLSLPACCMSHVVVEMKRPTVYRSNVYWKLFLFGGHSFAEDRYHTTLQVMDNDVNTLTDWEKCPMDFRGVTFFSTDVVHLPSAYVRKFH